MQRTRIRNNVWLGAALACAAVAAEGRAQGGTAQEGVPRPVTATGCVLRVEQVLGNAGGGGARGAPQFILMNASITGAGAATADPAARSAGAAGANAGRDEAGPRGNRSGRGAGGDEGRQAGQGAGGTPERPQQPAAGNRASNVVRQYLLESAANLSPHVGQQVEVSGSLEPITNNPANIEPSGAAPTSGNPILKVKSIKALGKPCSA